MHRDPGVILSRTTTIPHGGVLADDGWALTTASPETFVEVQHDGLTRSQREREKSQRGG
jgi:hypothetical protein